MASKAAIKRLTKEYKNLNESPIPYIFAKPLETNILEWHYILTGPPDSPYEGGQYHGKVVFPSEYPYKPPSILMTTPNGRFATDRRLCLSYSDFHPDLWNPSWSVATILNGLLSFMLENQSTSGSIETSTKDKKILAAKSHQFNLNNRQFISVFPEYNTVEAKENAETMMKHSVQLKNSTVANESNSNSKSSTPTTNNTSWFQGRVKWIIFGIIFSYLFISKLLSRVSI